MHRIERRVLRLRKREGMGQWTSPDSQRLLAEAPFADDQQDIIDVDGAVVIDIGGAIYIGNAITPGSDDREDVVHIDLAVTIGVGAVAISYFDITTQIFPFANDLC